jgi:hypothetical protein
MRFYHNRFCQEHHTALMSGNGHRLQLQ